MLVLLPSPIECADAYRHACLALRVDKITGALKNDRAFFLVGIHGFCITYQSTEGIHSFCKFLLFDCVHSGNEQVIYAQSRFGLDRCDVGIGWGNSWVLDSLAL